MAKQSPKKSSQKLQSKKKSSATGPLGRRKGGVLSFVAGNKLQVELESFAGEILEHLVLEDLLPKGVPRGEVSVELAPNRVMRAMKWRFLRKRPRIVDVLAFPSPQGFPQPNAKGGYLGEVYINSDVARRSVRRAKYLVIHGILHLIGYLHDTESDIIRMEVAEKKIMRHFDLEEHPEG